MSTTLEGEAFTNWVLSLLNRNQKDELVLGTEQATKLSNTLSEQMGKQKEVFVSNVETLTQLAHVLLQEHPGNKAATELLSVAKKAYDTAMNKNN